MFAFAVVDVEQELTVPSLTVAVLAYIAVVAADNHFRTVGQVLLASMAFAMVDIAFD